MAIAGSVLGIVWSAIWALMIFSQTQTYTIHFSDTLYGTTCSEAPYNYPSFNQYQAAVVYSNAGQQVASGTYSSGVDGHDFAQSGSLVSTCTFTAVIQGIPKSLSNYILDDNGEGSQAGISYTERQVAKDNVTMSRGYSSY